MPGWSGATARKPRAASSASTSRNSSADRGVWCRSSTAGAPASPAVVTCTCPTGPSTYVRRTATPPASPSPPAHDATAPPPVEPLCVSFLTAVTYAVWSGFSLESVAGVGAIRPHVPSLTHLAIGAGRGTTRRPGGRWLRRPRAAGWPWASLAALRCLVIGVDGDGGRRGAAGRHGDDLGGAGCVEQDCEDGGQREDADCGQVDACSVRGHAGTVLPWRASPQARPAREVCCVVQGDPGRL